MGPLARVGLCAGIFLAGRWSSGYEISITSAAAPIEEPVPRALQPAQPVIDQFTTEEPAKGVTKRRGLIRLVPGYVIDPDTGTLIAVPEEITKRGKGVVFEDPKSNEDEGAEEGEELSD